MKLEQLHSAYLQSQDAHNEHLKHLLAARTKAKQEREESKKKMEMLRKMVQAMPDGDEKTRCIAHFKAYDEEQARFEAQLQSQEAHNNLLMEVVKQQDELIQKRIGELSTPGLSAHDLEFKMMMGPQGDKHVLDFQRDNPSLSYKEAEYMLWKITGGYHQH